MGRRINPIALGRPAFCNVCFMPCNTLDQAGKQCYRCFKGEFVHRMYWHQTLCSCGKVPDCPWCGGCGYIAIPREDDVVWHAFDDSPPVELIHRP